MMFLTQRCRVAEKRIRTTKFRKNTKEKRLLTPSNSAFFVSFVPFVVHSLRLLVSA
jgi:hypothetical protein